MALELLLVEDDADYAHILSADLQDADYSVRVETSGPAALLALGRQRFDAVVLDRMLPSIDGISTLRHLRDAGHTLPVIMLTALGRSVEKVQGLEAGADDYVVKPVAVEELDARLQAILRGRRWTGSSADTLCAGNITVSPSTFRAWIDAEPLDLSRLQFRLLLELVRGAGAVLTRSMLVQNVWGYDFEPTGNIVDAHVRGLRVKLTAGGQRDPIVTVRGVGYMLPA